MKQKILNKLRVLEKLYDVKFLFAIESGSRAWGFASLDSDYDVRCVHVGKTRDYLGLFKPPRQINYLRGVLDIESWEITKFCELTTKSNPQIAEWVRSPIIYKDLNTIKDLRKIFDKGCSLEYLKNHYLSMAKQNFHKYMGVGMSHSCKKYLYVLRAIACARFISKNKKLPPLPYNEVINFLPGYVQKFFKKCIDIKINSEKAEVLADKKISRFIDSYVGKKISKKTYEFKKINELNNYLIRTIQKNQAHSS